MTLTDKLNRFRDRVDPDRADRAERAARAAGKSEAEIAHARKKATRRKRLLGSGGADGGSFGG